MAKKNQQKEELQTNLNVLSNSYKNFLVDLREFYSQKDRPFAIKICEINEPRERTIIILKNFYGCNPKDIQEIYIQTFAGSKFSNRKNSDIIGAVYLKNEIIIATNECGKIGFNTSLNDRKISFEFETIFF